MDDDQSSPNAPRPQELCALERKCLSLAAEGTEISDIAIQLAMVPKEVEVLLFCAQRKLGATNMMQALARYLAYEMAGTIRG